MEEQIHLNGAEILRLAKKHEKAFNIQYLHDKWGMEHVPFNNNKVHSALKYLVQLEFLEFEDKSATYSLTPKAYEIDSYADFETTANRKARKAEAEKREQIKFE